MTLLEHYTLATVMSQERRLALSASSYSELAAQQRLSRLLEPRPAGIVERHRRRSRRLAVFATIAAWVLVLASALEMTAPSSAPAAVAKSITQPGITHSAYDAARGLLVVSHQDRGELEVVRVPGRTTIGVIPMPGDQGVIRFAPDGLLWAAEEHRNIILVMDVERLRIVDRLPAGDGRIAMAFTPSGRRALVTASLGEVHYVDAKRRASLARIRVSGRPTEVRYLRSARAFSVMGGAGEQWLFRVPAGVAG